MNYVITGHKGLIGSALKKRLDNQGHRCILAVDKLEGSNMNDIQNKTLNEPVDVFFHLAAFCKINKSITNPETVFEDNTKATYNIYEFCRKNNIKKVMSFSSSRILSPEKNPYTASKIYGEELAKAYKQCYDIDYIIIRPSTVYGPFNDQTKRLIHIFITNALAGRDLEIYGDETKTLDFTYIDDFIDGILLSMKEWNQEYNISGEDEILVTEIAKDIISLTNSTSNILFKDKEIAQPQHVSVDTTKIRDLGYLPKIKIKEGVEKTVDWYKENFNQINSNI